MAKMFSILIDPSSTSPTRLAFTAKAMTSLPATTPRSATSSPRPTSSPRTNEASQRTPLVVVWPNGSASSRRPPSDPILHRILVQRIDPDSDADGTALLLRLLLGLLVNRVQADRRKNCRWAPFLSNCFSVSMSSSTSFGMLEWDNYWIGID